MRNTTYCRLCEVGCGLVAEIGEDGRVASLRPDKEHPVTAGFACNKGLLATDVHRDPSRVRRPQRRRPDGSYEDVSWDEALDDIAGRLRVILDEHGPSALGLYMGNPTAFNTSAGPSMGGFLAQLGSDRMFTAASQDCANKYAIGELLWGSAQVHLIPDLDRTDHLLLLGTNPRISKSSFLSVPDPVGRLAAIAARGGVVRFVDPRHGEPNVGETIQIQPGTDVFLLAAMLCEIDRGPGFDADGASRVRDLDALRSFVAQYPPERVAPVVGIDAARITTMALEFAAAPTASAHCSTGVNMGRDGALAYWLLQMLVLLTGNFDQPGGNIPTARATAPTPNGREAGPAGFVQSPWGAYRPTAGGQPGALLAEMLRGEHRIRAFFCVAGNPALSIGGGAQLQDGLAELDLLVTLDYYRNATGELADYVLPAADWFEREDLNTFVQGTQPQPYVQWTAPLVEPLGECRTERDVFTELSARLSLNPIFPPGTDVLAMLYDGPLAGHGLSMSSLRSAERGLALLDRPEPGGFLDRMTPDGVVDGEPLMLEPARERASAHFEELAAAPPDQLRLITRRTSHTINTALQNVARLKRGAGADNPLYLSPADAARLGILDGELVHVSNQFGAIDAPARIDPTLRVGVVAMTHGFGNARTSGQPVAQQHPGVNVNELSPVGPGSFDPVSTMSRLTGIAVDVAPVRPAPLPADAI